MNVGDLIRITSIKNEVLGLVIEVPSKNDLSWTCIMDCCGNIIWWPPEEVATLNCAIEIYQEGDQNGEG